MKCKWEIVELSDVLQEKGYIRGPFGSALKRGDMKNTGIPVYEQQHAIYDNREFRYFIDENKFEEMKRFQVQTNDLIISCSGTVGKVSIIKNIDPMGIISQALLILRVNEKKILPLFLKYFFSSKEGYNAIISRSSGSVQVNIAKRKVIEKIPIKLPSINIQKNIIKILNDIDKKIELNNKINENLINQSVTLFNKLIKNKNKNGCIGDYCSIKSGFAFKSSWWQKSGIKVIKIGSINQDNLNLDTCSYVSEDRLNIASDFIVKSGDLVIAMTGATIGKFSMIPYINEKILVNQRVGKFILGDEPIKKLPFIYCQLKQDEVYNEIINRGQGSAQPNISATDIMTISCVIPKSEIINSFNDICYPIFELIIRNQSENKQLIQLRDTLLPKLMNGEIDVSEVEV